MEVGGVDDELLPVGLDSSGGEDPPVTCRVRVGTGSEHLGDVLGLVDGCLSAELEPAMGDLVLEDHTYATIALADGTHPKVVADRLGHSTTAITLDIYSHVIPSVEEQAASRIANLIFGDAGLTPVS